MKRKNVKLLTAILLMFCLMLSGSMFAYWANSVSGDEDSTTTSITIGAGEEKTTTISLSEVQKTEGKLVPVGYEQEGSVSQIVVTYNVTLQADELGSNGAEAVLSITHSTLPSSLIVVVIEQSSSSITAGGSPVTVTVKISLTEPANEEEYLQVANLVFDLGLTFTATI